MKCKIFLNENTLLLPRFYIMIPRIIKFNVGVCQGQVAEEVLR